MEGGLLSLKWNNHRSSFIHVLSSLRKKDSFCDVTIACEGKFYPSHKLVLSTCSEYFQDMFQHTQCKHPVIVLKDIHGEDLEALLNYMYVGEVNVLQEKLSTLIKAAECLKIKGLAVPDDPPKDAGGEKRSSGHDLTPESKRRRTESSKSFSKHFNKSSDASFKHSGMSHDNSSFPASSKPSNNEINSPSYSFDNDNSTSGVKSKGRDSNFIKQEPPDTFPEVEDSKEGILQGVHADFLSPLPQEEGSNLDVHDDTSNIDIMGTDSQEIWGSESRSGDNYPSMDGREGGEGGPEDGQQNETAEWRGRKNSSGSWKGGGGGESEMEREAAAAFRLWKLQNASTASDILSWLPAHTLTWSDQGAQGGPGTECSVSKTSTSPSKYECSICSKCFDHKGNYRKHIRTHTGEKPFECVVCHYSASQKGNLIAHIKRMHSDVVEKEHVITVHNVD